MNISLNRLYVPFFVLLLCWMFCCDFDIGFISSRFFSVGLVSTEIVVSLFNSQLRYGSALCVSLVGAFVAESPDTSWVVDSGSTHHMTFDRSLFDPDSFTPPLLLPPSLEFRWETDLWPISKVVGQLPFLPRCIGGMVF